MVLWCTGLTTMLIKVVIDVRTIKVNGNAKEKENRTDGRT